MTLFIDASAMVAILTGEPEADDLEATIALDLRRITSAVAEWETARALANKGRSDLAVGRGEVRRFCDALDVRTVLIGAAEAEGAAIAYDLYGRGNHPARLNMGDCFAYACAKTNGARLLYKGDDFAQTDLA